MSELPSPRRIPGICGPPPACTIAAGRAASTASASGVNDLFNGPLQGLHDPFAAPVISAASQQQSNINKINDIFTLSLESQKKRMLWLSVLILK
jgi:hypothetical protein